jgi:hypothetical protein
MRSIKFPSITVTFTAFISVILKYLSQVVRHMSGTSRNSSVTFKKYWNTQQNAKNTQMRNHVDIRKACTLLGTNVQTTLKFHSLKNTFPCTFLCLNT